MLDYKLLQALAMVVQEGGFERAASVLCLTQSAVSQRVRLLEDRVGQVLLSRGTPPAPTAIGQVYLKHYNRVRLLEEDLEGLQQSASAESFVSVPVGVNADSLETWFLDSVEPFLREHSALLDLRVDDQDQTHHYLKLGEVVGCVSAEAKPVQGCACYELGQMTYRMLGTPEFVEKWFPDGFRWESALRAPAVIFSRDDQLHHRQMDQAFGKTPARLQAHYTPSAEPFLRMIRTGFAYGMLPDLQSGEMMTAGRLVELIPEQHVNVRLFWHCWNLESELLQRLTHYVRSGARCVLEPAGEME